MTKKLVSSKHDGRTISRRKFLCGMAGLSGLGIIAGCTAPAPGVAPATTPAPAMAETSAAGGGVLNWNIGGSFPDHLNSLTQTTHRIARILKATSNRLVTFDEDLAHLLPDLAEKWETSSNGRTITFHLRQGVKWHDGESFTANDVAFTYQAAAHPDAASIFHKPLQALVGAPAYAEGQADMVEGIQVVDDHTIMITTTEPAPGMIPAVCSQLSIIPAHKFEGVEPADYGKTDQLLYGTVGTGPFRVSRVQEGEFFELEANPDYWRGAPKLDKIVAFYLDGATAVAALEAGDIHLTSVRVGPDTARLRQHEELNEIPYPAPFAQTVTFNTKRIDDLRVREAMMHAIDVEAILRDLQLGLGEPIDTIFTHAWLQSIPELKKREYDPDKARNLLEEANWDSSRVLDWALEGESPNEVNLAVQQMWKDVGIETKLRGLAGAAVIEEIYINYNFDVSGPGGWTWGVDPDNLAILFECGRNPTKGGYNASQFCDPRVDELFAQGRITADVEERRQIYHEIAQSVNRELPLGFLFRAAGHAFARKEIGYATPRGFGRNIHYNGAEKWEFA
jgi:peptide/nickel transport system substrate-binding protein